MSDNQHVNEDQNINSPAPTGNSTEEHVVSQGSVKVQDVASGPSHKNTNANKRCFNCNERGHVVPDCPKPRARGRLPFAPRNQKTVTVTKVYKFSNIKGGKFHF